MIPASRRAGAILLAAVLLGGCRASGPEPEFFPLASGRWTYALRMPDGSGELVLVARGQVALPKGGGAVYLMEETMDASLGFGETAPVAYVIEGGYVARLAGVGYDGGGRLYALGQDRPTRVLPLSPRPGMRFSQETSPLGGTEGSGQSSLSWEVEIRGLDAITVPAGSFDDVIEVSTLLRDSSGVRRMEYRDVYARGVGLVSSVARESGNGRVVLEKKLLLHEPQPEAP